MAFARIRNMLAGMRRSAGETATGARGERAAVDFLCAAGYRILQRNWRCPLGEIDVICRDGETLVFVEVKASEKPGVLPPEVRVNQRKRAKLHALAAYYIKQSKQNATCRFDVIAVVWLNGAPQLKHFKNAF